MKKLLDNKFLFIVALSTVVLMILGVLAFYLFDDSDDVFIKSGYVLNPLSAKSEKFFFDANTSYHENLSSMVVFDDTDKNEVSVFKESFVHYMDNSLSFLKNGAILDLDSIKGKEAVKFYNITSKSMINKKNDEYVIENSGADIILKDFIGRISDNKYVVVGSLEAKIPGNDKNINGDYFEIVYADEGVINIENKDVKFQVMAEGSYIYVGNVVIDLGNKKITKDNDDVMSITAITISGNENIDIIPKAEDKEDDNGSNGNNTNNQPINQDNTGENPSGTEDGGNGGEGGQTDVVATEPLTVQLSDSSIGSTNITVTFDVDNYMDDDILTLKVTNLDTGRTVNKFDDIHTGEEIRVNLLSPDTKYLFSVVNEKDESKYYQKILKTNDFGINFLQSYVTDSEIGYKVIIDEDSEITDARITLKKFNEDVNENEIVGTYHLRDMMPVEAGEHDGIIFSGLDSDTIYTASVDNFSFATTMFNDIYNISLTSLTLKKSPTFGEMKKEVNNDNFKLYLDSVIDTDNAITSYSYYVYESSNPQRPFIDPIVKTNASAVTINIGEGVNELRYDVNYFYKVAIEYYDNQKYVEYVMDGQLNLYKGSDPYITITKNEDLVSYNQIGATIYLMDNSCLISMSGRDKCDSVSSVQIDIKKKNYGFGGTETSIVGYPINNVDFDVDGKIIKKDIVVENLEPGVTYVIYVSAIRNDQPDKGLQLIYEPDGPTMITTKNLASFNAKWQNGDSTIMHPIDAKVSLNAVTGINSLSGEDTSDLIKKVIVRLYDGEFNGALQSQKLIISREFTNTDDFNIKDKFYDNEYVVTSDETFGINIDELKTLTGNSDGKLSEYYTLYIEAFYDIGETSPVNITGKQTSYYIDKSLRADDISEPIVDIVPIKKVKDDMFSELLTVGTTVGYTVTASIDKLGFINNGMTPENVNFYVYNADGEQIQFYIKDGDNLELVDKYTASLLNSGSKEIDIYMGYGTSYGVKSNIMTRGNKYYIGYDISYTDSDNKHGLYPSNTNSSVPVSYGIYSNDVAIVSKDNPKINYLYPTKSTVDNKINYRYSIVDIDNSLYFTDNQYKLYYTVNDGDEKEINIVKTDDDIATFMGTFTISELNNGDGYTIYEKVNEINSGNIDEDILNKTIGYDNRLFDGYYDAKDSKYNFKYEVINNPLLDNKVTIKILASEDILNRVLSYKVKFTDSDGHTYDKELWNLIKCDGDNDSDIGRCFSVEYTEIKNMKSDGNNINNIYVDIDAIYDNGLMGMDYNGMVGLDKDYPYMILQENSTLDKTGNYYILNNLMLIKRTDYKYPFGYYTFEKVNDNTLNYNSLYNPRNKGTYNIYLGMNGYEFSSGEFIPKMVSVDKMSGINNNFSFSSITPMIKVNNTTSIINGAKIDLTLSGADKDDFCNDENGANCVTNSDEKYLYLAVWDNPNDVDDISKIAIPFVKVALNSDNINGSYEAMITNLLHGSKYYYNVYAYLNNNGHRELTRLFDASYRNKSVTYEFSSKKLSDIYDSYLVSYRSNQDGEYNDKLLDVRINVNGYDAGGNIPLNYTVSYALCNDDNFECSLSNNIFSSEIEETSTSMSDLTDITEYNLEFGKNYFIYLYATYDYYDKDSNSVKSVTYPFYDEIDKATVYLNPLKSPNFVFSREAKYVDGDYVIDLRVNVNDSDKVLNNGKYFVKLTDALGNVVGDLQILNEDNNYVTIASGDNYLSYEFDATVSNRAVRFKGLNENTKYVASVYSNAFINNASLEDKSVMVENVHTIYSTNSSGIAFGNDVYYSATANSILINFPGGSSFDGVTSVIYSVLDYDKNEIKDSGTYIIGENDKYFEIFSDTDEWRFVIDPEGMKNELGHTYIVTTAYYVKNAITGEEEYYDSTYNHKFSGPVQYTKNNNN